MKLINTLASVQETLVEANRNTWDALLEPSEITLVQGRVVSPRLYRYEYPTGSDAHALGNRAAVPVPGDAHGLFSRCPPELQDTQFNHWIQERLEENRKAPKADRWLLRAKGDTLRGVLTERYVRLDHLELFAAVSPALSSDYEVDWFAVTDESFHLRLHDARLYRDALPGDRLMAGVHIGNSEVGKRAVTVDALVYRLVCTNGLIRKVGGASMLHQRHIALSRPEFLQSVQQAVHEALAQSAAYLDRLAASVAYPIPNVERTLHKIALDWGLTQATEEAVKAAMLLEKPSQHETLYGLINGLTSAARGMAPDERYTLETQAGQLLEDRAQRPLRLRLWWIRQVLSFQLVQRSSNSRTATVVSRLSQETAIGSPSTRSKRSVRLVRLLKRLLPPADAPFPFEVVLGGIG